MPPQGVPEHCFNAIWILPDPESRAFLDKVICGLAAELGGPMFAPHVTLLSGICASVEFLGDWCERAAEEFLPFMFSAKALQVGDSYFRGMTLKIETSEPLMRLYADACRCFARGTPVERNFSPHLSLFYGFPDSAHVRLLAKNAGIVLPFSFRASKLIVVRTEGPVADWKRVWG